MALSIWDWQQPCGVAVHPPPLPPHLHLSNDSRRDSTRDLNHEDVHQIVHQRVDAAEQHQADVPAPRRRRTNMGWRVGVGVCCLLTPVPRAPAVGHGSRKTLRLLAQRSNGRWAMGRDNVSRWSTWRNPSVKRAGPVRL
eukprot:354266-Chlamydomonas_euryale.AAC.3